MRDKARDEVQRLAKVAAEGGLESDGEFNIVQHELETVTGLVSWLAFARRAADSDSSRGKRRTARKVGHALENAIGDLDAEVPDSLGQLDQPEGGLEASPWVALAGWVQWRMWEVALNAAVMSTQRRAVRDVRALGRLLNALRRRDIHPPVAPARGGVARPRRVPDRDAYGENQNLSNSLSRGKTEEEEEDSSSRSHRVPDGAGRATPPGAREGLDSGSDSDNWKSDGGGWNE